MSFKRRIQMVWVICLILIFPSCEEAPSQAESRGSSNINKNNGFEAIITGSYQGRLVGAGVLKLLPEAGFRNQGYLFLADGQGTRPFGVTFILPRGLSQGRHLLHSPSPLDIGTVASVRVDREIGGSVVSADKNTSGFLDLAAFPDSDHDLSGSAVTGSFEFETEDPAGGRVAVKGRFSFKAQ